MTESSLCISTRELIQITESFLPTPQEYRSKCSAYHFKNIEANEQRNFCLLADAHDRTISACHFKNIDANKQSHFCLPTPKSIESFFKRVRRLFSILF